MRQLLDDFLHQSWAMKLFVLWGWLAVVIMVSSFSTTVVQVMCDPPDLAGQEREKGMVCRILTG